jgi:hypothetical protein
MKINTAFVFRLNLMFRMGIDEYLELSLTPASNLTVVVYSIIYNSIVTLLLI